MFKCIGVCIEWASICVERGGMVYLYMLACVYVKYLSKLCKKVPMLVAWSGKRQDKRKILFRSVKVYKRWTHPMLYVLELL